MSAGPAEKPGRTRRLWIMAAGVFAAQLVLIFWLSEDREPLPRPGRKGPELTLAGSANPEFMSLMDPTHFALPHHEGFAGRAWLITLNPPEQSFEWTEPPRWKELTAADLGTAVSSFPEAPAAGATSGLWMPADPLLRPPEVSITPVDTTSSYRIEGEPPVPSLIAPLRLPSWPPRQVGPTDPELLTNSVVQLMLNVRGEPVSATLLVRSGSAQADEYALAEARKARFTPAPGASSDSETLSPNLNDLRWCRMVFEWATSGGTNAPVAQR